MASTSRLLLIELANDDPGRLAAMSKAMARALATVPEFRYVANGESAFGARRAGADRALSLSIERSRRCCAFRGAAAACRAGGAAGRAVRRGRRAGEALAGQRSDGRDAARPRADRAADAAQALRWRLVRARRQRRAARRADAVAWLGLRGPEARDCRRRTRLRRGATRRRRADCAIRARERCPLRAGR